MKKGNLFPPLVGGVLVVAVLAAVLVRDGWLLVPAVLAVAIVYGLSQSHRR